MAIDVRTRTQEIVARIEAPEFLEQIRESLPESVTLDRFKRVAITAVRSNPDLATADKTTLLASIIRCAQDGLLPDQREAALVIYKGKVGYLRMIGGIRKIAAEYGWAIRTNVVYENDSFEYTDEPPEIHHRPVRPGEERGHLIAAYAVATHRDGRRLQTVLHPDDVAKRRAKAQTQAVWREWEPQMWEKSAGHDIFGQLPLDSSDLRISRVLQDGVLVDPIAALYGGPTTPPTDETTPDQTPTASNNGAEPEDADWTPVDEDPIDEEALAAASATVIPSGAHKDLSFADVAALEGGPAWFLTQLKRVAVEAPIRPTLEMFVRGRLPDEWDSYLAWKDEQS